MQNVKRQILFFEGLGSACLLGLFTSSLQSLFAFLYYFKVKLMSPVSLSSISRHDNSLIQVSSKIHSAGQVFYIKTETERSLLDFSNIIEERMIKGFYLDESSKILVTPNLGTAYLTYSKETYNKPAWREILLKIAMIPLSIIRYFTGIRVNLDKKNVFSCLSKGDPVFILGICASVLGKIEISPKIISVSREEAIRFLRSETMKSVFFPLVFLIGCLVSWAKIKSLEKVGQEASVVITDKDMKCKECGVNTACIVLLPCRHLNLCDECLGENCPSCGKKVSEKMRIFSS